MKTKLKLCTRDSLILKIKINRWQKNTHIDMKNRHIHTYISENLYIYIYTSYRLTKY